MHAPKLSDADLNLLARALDTLAEQAQVLKANVIGQVQAAQREAAKATEPKPPEKKKK